MKRVRHEELNFTNARGQKIIGKLYLPDEKGKYPTALFCHGFGSCMRHFKHYAETFTEKGVALLLFDFCGGGNKTVSDGCPMEMSCLTELEDFEAVIDSIKDHPEVDENNMFFMGESQGGLVAALAAAKYPDLAAGAVLWYPALHLNDRAKAWSENGIPETRMMWDVTVGRRYVVDALGLDIFGTVSAYEKDVLIIHGTEDKVVPIEYSVRALDVYKNAEIMIMEGAGHGFSGDDSEKVGNASADFCVKHNKNV